MGISGLSLARQLTTLLGSQARTRLARHLASLLWSHRSLCLADRFAMLLSIRCCERLTGAFTLYITRRKREDDKSK
jgi:hypothetical protein